MECQSPESHRNCNLKHYSFAVKCKATREPERVNVNYDKDQTHVISMHAACHWTHVRAHLIYEWFVDRVVSCVCVHAAEYIHHTLTLFIVGTSFPICIIFTSKTGYENITTQRGGTSHRNAVNSANYTRSDNTNSSRASKRDKIDDANVLLNLMK